MRLLSKSTLLLIVLSLLTACITPAHADDRDKGRRKSSSGSGAVQIADHMVIIKLKPLTGFTTTGTLLGVAGVDPILKRIGVRSLRPLKPVPAGGHSTMQDASGVTRIVTVVYTADEDPTALARELAADPAVEYAEPVFIFPLSHTPNDPMLAQQWALTMMKMAQAWDVTTGSATVWIGDIDTGTDWTHPDLKDNIAINPGEWGTSGELSTNGIDDDGNGKVDDYHGWDFIGTGTVQAPEPDNNPMDGALGHGTNTAGCAAASTNNAVGIAGTGYRCKVLPIKASGDASSGVSGYEGIMYAADMGCKVINCSWGGTGGFSQALQDVINHAWQKGALVVASAGNDNIDNDLVAHYPSSFQHVLNVSSVESNGTASGWATFGGTVHVYAPGSSVLTTKKGGGYESPTGTSFSSPLTAGVAALIFAQHPTWTPDQVLKQIRVTSDAFSGTRAPKYYGRVNAQAAVTQNQTLTDIPGINIRSALVATPSGAIFREAGQSGTIRVKIENLLAPTSSAAVVDVTSLDTTLKLDMSSIALGVMATKDSMTVTIGATLSSAPLLSEGDILVQLKVTDGAYVDYLYIRVPVWLDAGWHTALQAEIPLFSSVSIVDHMSAWFTASVASTTTVDYCLRTVTAGSPWYNAMGSGWPTGAGVYTIEALSSTVALVGTGPSSGAAGVYRTTNGGQTWSGTSVSAYTPFVNWIHMFDVNNGVLQGDPKNNRWGICTTTDGGRTWSPITTPVTSVGTEAGWNNSCDFVGQTGWFGTNASKIYKTTDGGQTWRSFATPSNNSMDISFRDEQVGVARFGVVNSVGANMLAITTNGGETWTRLTSITVTGGRVMMERGGRRMWLLDNGNSTISTNLGASWRIQARPNGFTNISAGDIHSTATSTTLYAAGMDIFRFASPFEPLVGVGTTAVLPDAPVIDDVWPHPTGQAGTTVRFSLPKATQARLVLHDMTGREVETLVDATLEGGSHSVHLDAHGVTPGAYFLRLTAGAASVTRSVIITR